MSNTNNSVEIQNAIEVYETKQKFKTSVFLAALGAFAGSYYFSDPFLRGYIGVIFNIGFDTVPLAAAATGAFVGFF